MRHAPEVARDLKPRVCEFERASTVAASTVLRADQLLKHIEVRGLQPRTQAESHSLRKFSDLWDDPTQNVTREDHCGGLLHAQFFFAGAFGAGKNFNNSLL